jgi:hypothetical protein
LDSTSGELLPSILFLACLLGRFGNTDNELLIGGANKLKCTPDGIFSHQHVYLDAWQLLIITGF